MPRSLLSLLVFVLVLVGLNFLLGETDYGVHISIVGSLLLTGLVWLIMNGLPRGRR